MYFCISVVGESPSLYQRPRLILARRKATFHQSAVADEPWSFRHPHPILTSLYLV